MRDYCLDCVRKHLGVAVAQLDETHLGYPQYRWNVVGHLNEAESESAGLDLALAVVIRKRRLIVMKSHMDSYSVNIEHLIWLASHVAGENADLCFGPTNSKFLDCSRIISEYEEERKLLAHYFTYEEKLDYIQRTYPEPEAV
jgi:hypothetical protein